MLFETIADSEISTFFFLHPSLDLSLTPASNTPDHMAASQLEIMLGHLRQTYSF